MNLEEKCIKIKDELYKKYPIDEEISFNDSNLEEKLKEQLKLELKY